MCIRVCFLELFLIFRRRSLEILVVGVVESLFRCGTIAKRTVGTSRELGRVGSCQFAEIMFPRMKTAG